jgi:hypothetical protein
MLVLLLEFNSLDTFDIVMNAVTLIKMRQLRRGECRIATSV